MIDFMFLLSRLYIIHTVIHTETQLSFEQWRFINLSTAWSKTLLVTETRQCSCHVSRQQSPVSYCKSIRVWKPCGATQADQRTSPPSHQMSLLGRVQMVPVSSEGKVRVTQCVKLDPSWNWLRLQLCTAPPHSSAGIISIKAHAGWKRDYNRV